MANFIRSGLSNSWRNSSHSTGRSKNLLFISAATASVIASGLYPSGAYADDTIVVTGTRYENQQAIAAKRSKEIIADFLAANDIGIVPDYNVADAIRRVSGVNTVFDEDEGRYISMRGMDADFTYVTIDGGAIATLDLGGDFGGGRRAMLETIPSPAVKRLEILKSFGAAQDGQGIGGQVNVVTKSAFDYDDTYLVGAIGLGHYTSNDVPTSNVSPSYRGEITLAQKFGGNEEFGILLSGAYRMKKRDQQRINPSRYRYYDLDGMRINPPPIGEEGQYAYSRRVIYRPYNNEVEHLGGMAKLEYRPTGAPVEMSLQSAYWQQVDNEERYDLRLNSGGNPTEVFEDGTFLSTSGAIQPGLQTWYIKKYVWSNQFDADWAVDDDTDLSLRGTFSKSSWYEDAPFVDFGISDVDIYQTPGTENTPPRLTIGETDLATFNDPSAFGVRGIDWRYDDEHEEVYEIATDFEHRFSDTAPGLSLRTGAKWRKINKFFDRDVLFYNADATTITLDQVLVDGLENPDFIQRYADYPSYYIDADKFYGMFEAAPEGDFIFDEVGTNRSSLPPDYDLGERVAAVYGMFVHDGDRHQFYAGVRGEHTAFDGMSNLQEIVEDPEGDIETFSTVRRKGSYWSILPSVGFRYDLTPQLRLRLAYSETIGRPSFKDLAAPTSRFTNELGDISIEIGNPDLEPRTSENFDVSLEYYFDEGESFAGVAAFHKIVDNEIFVIRTEEEVEGVTTVTSQPRNAESATISGLEFTLVKNRFDFLPGKLSNFGFSGNLSLIKGDVAVTEDLRFNYRDDQPEIIINTTLFYQDGPIDARIVWNRTGKFNKSVDVIAPAYNQFEAKYDQLDASVSYEFTENFRAKLSGRNILNNPRITYAGPLGRSVRDYNYFGGSYWPSLAYSY